MVDPNRSIKTPDQRFMFIPKDFWYILTSEIVVNPYMPSNNPSIVNINPIGILISKPIISSFNFYQNKYDNNAANAKTKMASDVERLYHTTSFSTSFGVS
jgi:hypothetical protein